MGLSDATYEELIRAGDKINKENEQKRQKEQDEISARLKSVEFYVCPTPGCPGYYGSPFMDDTGIATDWTGQWGLNGEPQPPEKHRKRSDCLVCFDAGRGRIPMNRIRISVDPGKRREPEGKPASGRYAA